MRPLRASKGVVAFLAWPITRGNFVRIFCHLRRVCVRTFYLTPLRLVLSNETTVTNVHFIAESSSDVASSAHSESTAVGSTYLPSDCVPTSMLSSSQHQTISSHEYARHPLHYFCISDPERPLGTNTAVVTRTVAQYHSDTKCQRQPHECGRNSKPTPQASKKQHRKLLRST